MLGRRQMETQHVAAYLRGAELSASEMRTYVFGKLLLADRLNDTNRDSLLLAHKHGNIDQVYFAILVRLPVGITSLWKVEKAFLSYTSSNSFFRSLGFQLPAWGHAVPRLEA